jgi:NAD(P)-dependent dehydrogenase (short-subunit alcohol dehydrogenase family)
MKISGKKAVVFGGTSGIGLAIAKMLAQEGASVVAISRDPSKSGPLPAGVTTKSCDVRDGAAVERLLSEIGMMDILVSAATGGKRAFGPFVPPGRSSPSQSPNEFFFTFCIDHCHPFSAG